MEINSKNHGQAEEKSEKTMNRENSMNQESLSERFSNLKVWEQRGSVFRAPFSVPCCVCHRPTAFIDLDYEAAFCSEECLRVFEARLPQRGDSDAG